MRKILISHPKLVIRLSFQRQYYKEFKLIYKATDLMYSITVGLHLSWSSMVKQFTCSQYLNTVLFIWS